MHRSNNSSTSRSFLSLPLWLIVALCSGLPLAFLAWQVVSNPTVIHSAMPDAFRLRLLGRTLLYNGSTAIIATSLGIPVGLVLGRGRGIIAKILWVVLPVTLLLPSLAYAYGWSQFFRLCGIHLEPAGPADVCRCIWSVATWLWPISATSVGLALRRLDRQLQLQALLDGGLWRVTMRELAVPILCAAGIAGVLAVQEFAVYEPTGISVIATETRMVFETGAFSSPDNPITAPMSAMERMASGDQRRRAANAVATVLPVFLIILLVAIPILLTARNVSVTDEIDVGAWPRVLDVGIFAKTQATAVVLIAVVVPTLSLIFSLKVHRGPVEIWDEFSPQILGSLLIASLAAVVALFLAAWGAVTRVSVALVLVLVTFLIGGQLIAIAQIRLYNRPELGLVSEWIYNAPPVVVMAFLARFGWVALVAGRSTWSPRWRGLRDLAATDGAGAIDTARSVVWPIAWPLLVASGVLVMALSLTEVPATLLLSPQRPPMLTPMLMTWVHMLRYDPMIEASLMLMGVVAVLGLIVATLMVVGIRLFRGGLKPVGTFSAALIVACAFAGCDKSQPKDIWGETGTGPGQVVYPRAIVYKKQDDTFFIIDRMARVQHLDHKGKFLGEWRMPQFQIGKPVGVSVGPDGNVYIPDTHYQRVMVYSPDGELLRKWGSAGTGDGQFIYPTDIAFDDKGHVFVSEYGDNDRIQVFTSTGEFLYAFGKFGKEDGAFIRPQSMLIEGDTMYITDACNSRIVVFKTDGTFVRNMCSVGSGLGCLRYPYGLDEDAEGHLIVCEFGNNRVQMIDKQTGKGLKIWGGGGHDPGQLAYPWGVAVDKRDRVVAVDAGNNRLQVFEF